MLWEYLKSTKEFSNKVLEYNTIEKYKKQISVDICPNSINGDSTCLAPNCINTKKLETNTQKVTLLNGLNCIPLDLLISVRGKSSKIKIAENIAITPNSLLGIDLNIAQKGKRYHSGTMAAGVCIGFAIT